MSVKCPKCGTEVEMPKDGETEGESPEISIEIEGDPSSIKSILSKLIPEVPEGKVKK